MTTPDRPTTNDLIAQAHTNRQDEDYPDTTTLLRDLPDVLRGVCDYVLTGEASAIEVARALASLIDVIETTTAAHAR